MNIHLSRFLTFVCAIGCASSASATIFKVGPGGSHATIQAAIDAAVASPGNDEIRVHVGTYAESISANPSNADTLDISGGWGDGYLGQVRNGATVTVIQPPSGTRGALLTPTSGAVRLRDLSVAGALTSGAGAGISIVTTGTGTAEVSGCFVHDNTMAANSGPSGGGIEAYAMGFSHITLQNNSITRNLVQALTNVTNAAGGGGVGMTCTDTSVCKVIGNYFAHNRLEPKNFAALGAGIQATFAGNASGTIQDNVLEAQEIGGAVTSAQGISARVVTLGSGYVFMDRNEFRGAGEISPISATSEVDVRADNQSYLLLFDSLVAKSIGESVNATTLASGRVNLCNLTIAHNGGPVRLISGGASASLSMCNSVLFNPAASSETQFTGVTTNNLLQGVDPGFLAPGLYDYSVRRSGSPTMDAGLGNFGPEFTDLIGAPRVQGASVDIGAWESSDRLYADRFEN